MLRSESPMRLVCGAGNLVNIDKSLMGARGNRRKEKAASIQRRIDNPLATAIAETTTQIISPRIPVCAQEAIA